MLAEGFLDRVPRGNAFTPWGRLRRENMAPTKKFLSCVQDVIKFLEMIPKKMFFTKGVGVHKEKLASFEMALRVAGLAHCNLVLVSSIYPPGCKVISKDEGLKLLKPGEIVFAVYDRESSNEPNRLMAASVGVAIPADPSMHGYLSEHHSFGETDEKAENTQKIWLPACWRPRWESTSIPSRIGTNGSNFSKCPAKSSVRLT